MLTNKQSVHGKTFLEFIAGVQRLFLNDEVVKLGAMNTSRPHLIIDDATTQFRVKLREQGKHGYVSLRIAHPEFGEHTVMHFYYQSKSAPDASLVSRVHETVDAAFQLTWLAPDAPNPYGYGSSHHDPEPTEEVEESDPEDEDPDDF